MKKIYLVFLMSVIFLNGCNWLPTTDDGKLTIVSTIFPLSDIVSRLGGDQVNSVSLIPPGSSEHTYEPTPSDIQTLNSAELVIVIGAGMDDWIKEMMKNSGIEENKIVDLSQFVTLEKYGPEVKSAVEEDLSTTVVAEGSIDPHYWLSPKRVLEFLDDLKEKMKEKDIDNSGVYESRYENYKQEIEKLDADMTAKISSFSKKDVVTMHDAFGYLTRDYGLNLVAVIEPNAGSEPTPQDLTNLIAKIKELNIKAVYAEPQLSQKAIETISQDAGIQFGKLDPLGGTEARLTYVSIMKHNLIELTKFLQ